MLRNPRGIKFTRASRFEKIRRDLAPGAIYDNQPSYLDTNHGFSFSQAGRPKVSMNQYPSSSNDCLKVDLMKCDQATSAVRNPIVPVFGSERKDQILNATILKAHHQANYGKYIFPSI